VLPVPLTEPGVERLFVVPSTMVTIIVVGKSHATSIAKQDQRV
jgi:hypothetical protein